ncbi:MAG TPA: hypothetical protein DDY31_06585 [Lachnospiraceae bacterium]|nr:hypothetical protein [Lachnospiraceae bacterium]
MDFDSLKKFSASIKPLDISNLAMPEPIYPKFEIPDLPIIDPENTIMGDIKRKIEEQNTLTSQQINILVEQNKLLSENYNKLKDMYDAQAESYKSAQADLRNSRRYNAIMMIIAAVAMIAAIAGPIVTILVS